MPELYEVSSSKANFRLFCVSFSQYLVAPTRTDKVLKWSALNIVTRGAKLSIFATTLEIICCSLAPTCAAQLVKALVTLAQTGCIGRESKKQTVILPLLEASRHE